MSNQGHGSHWVSFSDMMTGLMLVFLLLAILMIHEVNIVVASHQNTKDELYQDLNKALENRQDEWGIDITKDLVVRFHNPDVLFEQDSSRLTQTYADILTEFVPLYLGVINQGKYKESIREVRIEGHTAALSSLHSTYIDTVQLSQDRAREILSFLMSHPDYRSLSATDQKKMQYWLTANGYGLGRAIDVNGKFVYTSGNVPSESSRRVEFSIITNSEEILNKLNKQ